MQIHISPYTIQQDKDKYIIYSLIDSAIIEYCYYNIRRTPKQNLPRCLLLICNNVSEII